MANDLQKSPKVFISYSWDDDNKTWVRDLATRLRANGVATLLDQWDVAPGDSLPEFMESSVSVSDFVLIVCTPGYKRKSNSSDPSGVGYEKGVITGELFVKRNQRKFIPVLRKGKWLDAAPAWVLGKTYIDLRGDPYSEDDFQELLRTLYGKREPPPPLGTPPDFPDKNENDKGVKPDTFGKFLISEGTFSRKAITTSGLPFFRSVSLIGIVLLLLLGVLLARSNIISLIPTSDKSSTTQAFGTELAAASSVISFSKTPRSTTTPTKAQPPTPIFTPGNISDKSGAEMMFVPAGEFIMGASRELQAEMLVLCQDCDPTSVTDQSPQRSVYLNDYWIDKTEVTIAQFQRFVESTNYATTAEKKGSSLLFDRSTKKYSTTSGVNWKKPEGKSIDLSQYKDYPVTHVSWDDAQAYCSWVNGRLPTEAEWEKAARWTDGRLFPWGNALPNNTYLNFDLLKDGPVAVMSYPAGISKYGTYDMAGNVWEWVNDWYTKNYTQSETNNPTGPLLGLGHIFRGGSWASELSTEIVNVMTTFRAYNQNYWTSPIIGFRCVIDVNP